MLHVFWRGLTVDKSTYHYLSHGERCSLSECAQRVTPEYLARLVYWQKRQGRGLTKRGYALFIVVVVLVVFVVAPVMISVVVAVRVVIVLNTAAITFPVACIVSLAIVVWANPASPFVGRSSPVAFVPLVMISHRIPITLHPHELRSWPFRHNHNHPGWRWRGNHDSNGNLRIDCSARS